MLTAFTLEDFRSYRQATLPLSALTVLIGANALGKSNAIEGLRLLSWLAQGQKLSSIQFEVQNGELLFLDPAPPQMRDYAFPSDRRLQGNGRNLSTVLYNLWGPEDQKEDEPWTSNRSTILDYFIQSLPEQNIVGLSFLQEPRGRVMLQLTETFGDRKDERDASLQSDRVLAIAAAMLSAPEGSLVVIEEIDNGVHPSRARHLLEQIQGIASRRNLRVLLSTHNPALLDALPDSAVPEMVFCYRHPKDGGSRLVRLADVADYPELIAQGTPDDLMTSGTLKRFARQARHVGTTFPG